jgi:hypothetical protein
VNKRMGSGYDLWVTNIWVGMAAYMSRDIVGLLVNPTQSGSIVGEF